LGGPGGTKGLWFSHSGSDDRRLVLTESAIDALSYATLFSDAADHTRYASLGGKLNSQQPDLVKATIARLPEGSEIVAAFDADGAGRMLVAVVRLVVAAVATETGRTDLIFNVHLPTQEGEDWNQVLQEHSQRKRNHPAQVYRFQDHLALETIPNFSIILGLENATNWASNRAGSVLKIGHYHRARPCVT
jgi:hypothetical protein